MGAMKRPAPSPLGGYGGGGYGDEGAKRPRGGGITGLMSQPTYRPAPKQEPAWYQDETW